MADGAPSSITFTTRQWDITGMPIIAPDSSNFARWRYLTKALDEGHGAVSPPLGSLTREICSNMLRLRGSRPF